MGTMRKLRACAAVLVVAAAVMATAVPSAMAVPGNFWGLVPQATPSPEQLQRLKRGGVDSLRVPVVWGSVQHSQDAPLNWSGIDGIVGNAAAAGIDVLPFLTGAPAWAVREIAVGRNRVKAPSSLPVRTGVQKAGWTNFVRGAVLRYGPNGSFWAENPALPKRPIRNWQIWNEPNFLYFAARPNPAEYGKLVNLSYSALKGADSGAKLILAGLFSRPFEATEKHSPPQAYFAADFLQQMYKRTPGIKSKFQGVALHPYTSNFRRLSPYIEEFRDVLKANRDAGKGLWLTEVSWSSQPPTRNNSFAKGRSGQVTQLRGAFSLIERNLAKWKVRRLYWFSIDDQAGTCNFCDGSGLFGEGFVPKPSWKAFVGFTGGRVN